MTTLNWQFDHSYARLPEIFFVEQQPKRAREPRLVLFNHRLADALGLNVTGLDQQALAEIFSGNSLPDSARPLAQAYAGHQFGGFSILGDGRALLIGEHISPDGERYDLQFKGSGPTAFSRRGDGLAALGPMLREYVISEAMHALAIPTTRSLAVVATGDPVWRENVLAGAVLTRVASSHLRVGTFQYAAARQDHAALASLVDYALWRHDPDLLDSANKPLALLEAVVRRQAHLIVEWMRVGFIHGVMNTDNMTISGETIDYGPCAFMDRYDPQTVFSSIDHSGRYAFANQPAMAQWNLARLAEALLVLIDPDPDVAVKKAEPVIHGFETLYLDAWKKMMASKIGLVNASGPAEQLMVDLLEIMHKDKADFTQTFARLGERLQPGSPYASSQNQTGESDAMLAWTKRWLASVSEQPGAAQAAQQIMQRVNPVYIARNHLVEEALSAATQSGDMAPLQTLLEVLARPCERRPGLERYEQPGQDMVPYQTFCGT